MNHNQALSRDLRKALSNRKFEVSDAGVLFPGARIVAAGIFETFLNDGPWEPIYNILPYQGLNMLLDVALGASSKETGWWFAGFATATDPSSSTTAANFNTQLTEFTNYSGGRLQWTPAAAVDGVITNAATPVTLTVGNATGLTNTSLHGWGLLSNGTKLSTSGKCAAAARLKDSNGDPKPKLLLSEGDVIGARYTLTLTST